VNGETLLARLQQFTNCVYGPVFAAGLNFWQLGDAHYWGHNCLIRIDPFMRHCALPRLPGRPPLGGEILSHDFVEAFLMRRAGWKVWLAYDLPGSYEQTPPTLIDELARDRRWCQGNLQHTRILTAAGMVPFQRYLFVNGIMSYITPALWAALLLLGSLEVFIQMRRVPVYFPAAANLFPAWPVNHPDIAARLLLGTCVVLFMPRILGIARVLLRQTQAGHGGALRLAASAFLEALSSMIFAPIRMAFHTKFAVLTLMGRTVRWDAQRRDHDGTSFREALRMHGAGSLIGLAWGIFAYRSNAAYFLWLTPVIGGLLLSIPASIFSSRRRSGQAAQRCGLFLIPEERQPPRELCWAAFLPPAPARPIDQVEGFVRAAVDPRINALHAAVVGDRPPRPSASAARAAARALAEGPQSLSRQEKMQLLGDPGRLRELHRGLWTADEALAPAWPLSALAQNAPPSSAQPGLASQARSGTGVSG
jgi:membrane glycosyltransferase